MFLHCCFVAVDFTQDAVTWHRMLRACQGSFIFCAVWVWVAMDCSLSYSVAAAFTQDAILYWSTPLVLCCITITQNFVLTQIAMRKKVPFDDWDNATEYRVDYPKQATNGQETIYMSHLSWNGKGAIKVFSDVLPKSNRASQPNLQSVLCKLIFCWNQVPT